MACSQTVSAPYCVKTSEKSTFPLATPSAVRNISPVWWVSKPMREKPNATQSPKKKISAAIHTSCRVYLSKRCILSPLLQDCRPQSAPAHTEAPILSRKAAPCPSALLTSGQKGIIIKGKTKVR